VAKQVAHFDLDSVKYSVASAAETRRVVAIHKTTGEHYDVKNRTQFYGRTKKRDGGLLAEINKGRDSPYSWDEFEYEDIQIPEPKAHAFFTTKRMVDKIVSKSGADEVRYYVGSGESFRVGMSTLLKYKGNREDTLKPVLLEDVVEYMINKYRPEVVTSLEADDAVVMESYGKSNHFIIGVDKDFYGSGSRFYNYSIHEEGIVRTEGLGELWLDNRNRVRGKGLLFKMLQIASEDNSDNYKANCFSEVRWAEKSAYQALVGVGDYKEAFERLVSIFKMLYPEEKKVVGWRGDIISINYMYVLQEMWNMAHMLRWDKDLVNVEDVLRGLNIKHEDIEPYKGA